jgi:hypothetical protein
MKTSFMLLLAMTNLLAMNNSSFAQNLLCQQGNAEARAGCLGDSMNRLAESDNNFHSGERILAGDCTPGDETARLQCLQKQVPLLINKIKSRHNNVTLPKSSSKICTTDAGAQQFTCLAEALRALETHIANKHPDINN